MPTPSAPSRGKSVLTAALLSLIPGAGYLYLGQRSKGIVLPIGIVLAGIATSGVAFVPLLPLSLFLCVPDAVVLARRTKSGRDLRPWEWFWSGHGESTWSVSEVRQEGRTEQKVGTDSKVLNNSGSDSRLVRTFKVSREWSHTYNVETESSQKISNVSSLQVKDGPGRTHTVEEALRKRLSYTETTKHLCEENVTVDVPPRSRVTVYFHWKNILETGVMVLRNRRGETAEVPFSVVVDLTFDQEQVDAAPV